MSAWRLKTLAVTEGKLCVRSPVSEGQSDLTKCANAPLVWKAKTTGLHNGGLDEVGWLSVGGGGGGGGEKPLKLIFQSATSPSVSHL